MKRIICLVAVMLPVVFMYVHASAKNYVKRIRDRDCRSPEQAL
jgi:hypothetical protein